VTPIPGSPARPARHKTAALRGAPSGRCETPRPVHACASVSQSCSRPATNAVRSTSLRAALSYCLFGVDDCADLHRDTDLRPPPFWQRAFDAKSPQRQGELLAEMARFDPALEADPIFDRKLLRDPPTMHADDRLAPDRLAWARRRAWRSSPSVLPAKMPARCMAGIRLKRTKSFRCGSSSATGARSWCGRRPKRKTVRYCRAGGNCASFHPMSPGIGDTAVLPVSGRYHPSPQLGLADFRRRSPRD
jgi:hypothetical protein